MAPGSYYVLVLASDYGPKPVVWSVPVVLKAGANTVALTPKNMMP